MIYPRLTIKTDIIKKNTKIIVDICKEKGIDVVGVTKGVCGDKNVVEAFIAGGIQMLGDARIENLINLKDYKIPKMMIRIPMLSEANLVVKYADISLNSEIKTIRALDKASKEAGKTHKIVLMIDLGDLREGFFYEKNLFKTIDQVLKLKNIKLEGIATNLTCFGGVVPEISTMETLNALAETIEDRYKMKLEIVSGGNSSTLYLLENWDINSEKIKEINNLRLGESLLLGKSTLFDIKIKGTEFGAFVLETEIIEKKLKPTVPIGIIGKNAFGNIPDFIDMGVRERLICAIGIQDVEIDSLVSFDKDLKILGASSDHLIIDSSDSENGNEIGEIIKFNLNYEGILGCMTSPYVKKRYL